MADQTITYSECKAEFPLTTSLAAPIAEATRHEFEQKLAAKDAQAAERETALREKEAALESARQSMDAELAQRIASERAKFTAEEQDHHQCRQLAR